MMLAEYDAESGREVVATLYLMCHTCSPLLNLTHLQAWRLISCHILTTLSFYSYLSLHGS